MSEKKLDAAISEVEKRFGKGTLVELDSTRTDAFPVISTGNTVIDELTGIGGFPKGRIVEIDGLEGGGKTTLCLQVVAQAQKAGGTCVYIDAEHTLDTEYAAKLGVDTSKLLLSQPDCGEDALEVALCMVRSGAVAVVVVDSVSALVPRKELEGDIGDAQILSSSPECFLKLEGRQVITRPIKGTRPRAVDPAELLASPKDNAELLMITDLERNDLGRVATAGSVRVDPYRVIERRGFLIRQGIIPGYFFGDLGGIREIKDPAGRRHRATGRRLAPNVLFDVRADARLFFSAHKIMPS